MFEVSPKTSPRNNNAQQEQDSPRTFVSPRVERSTDTKVVPKPEVVIQQQTPIQQYEVQAPKEEAPKDVPQPEAEPPTNEETTEAEPQPTIPPLETEALTPIPNQPVEVKEEEHTEPANPIEEDVIPDNV